MDNINEKQHWFSYVSLRNSVLSTDYLDFNAEVIIDFNATEITLECNNCSGIDSVIVFSLYDI